MTGFIRFRSRGWQPSRQRRHPINVIDLTIEPHECGHYEPVELEALYDCNYAAA